MINEFANGPAAHHEPDKDHGPDAAIVHREQCWEFILKDASPWYREHLAKLGLLWDKWNIEVFNGEFQARPHILLATTGIPNSLGDYGRIGGWGGKAQIRIRSSLLTGTHPLVASGDRFKEGRFLFVQDVLLHECVHQYQHEILGIEKTSSYISHGPTYRDKANEISAKIGLGRVRASKTRGKDKDLPSCAYWPHCVRPDYHYKGAYLGRESNQILASKSKVGRFLLACNQPSVDHLLKVYDELPLDERHQFVEGLRMRGEV
ncbi:MAG: hypothetical protein ACLQPD_28165 [Desulfomonilaceae bacterium]